MAFNIMSEMKKGFDDAFDWPGDFPRRSVTFPTFLPSRGREKRANLNWQASHVFGEYCQVRQLAARIVLTIVSMSSLACSLMKCVGHFIVGWSLAAASDF
eukprot:1292164-Amphidinium_carterae.1